MNRIKQYFNWFYISFVIIWPAIQNFILGGVDGAGRITFLFTLIAIVVNYKDVIFCPRSFYLLYAWVIYSIINSIGTGHDAIGTIPFASWTMLKLVQPVVFLVVLYNELKTPQYQQTEKILYYTLCAYLIIGAVFLRPTLMDDLEVRIMNCLGNDYFNTLMFVLPVGVLLLISKKIKFLTFFAIVLLTFAIIVIGAERKAIGGFAITLLLSLFALFYYRRTDPLLVLSFIILFSIGVFFVLNFTILGERLLGGSSVHNAVETNWFLKLMGDRGVQYVGSWEFFRQNPVTGIGLLNYSIVNTHQQDLPLHSEYMVQLAECGLVGATLKFIFLLCVFGKLKIDFKNRNDVSCKMVFIASVLALLFINFTTWTYDMPIKYAVFAFVFAYQFNKPKVLYYKVVYGGAATK